MAHKRRIRKVSKAGEKERQPQARTINRVQLERPLDPVLIQQVRSSPEALKPENVSRLQIVVGNQVTGELLKKPVSIPTETVTQRQNGRSRSMSAGGLPRPKDFSNPLATSYTVPKVADNLNKLLRNKKLPAEGTLEFDLYKSLISMMEKNKGPKKVYRGLDLKGDLKDENGFMSTSKGNPYLKDTLLILDVSEVARAEIEHLSHFGLQWDAWLPDRNEQEVLIQPMTIFAEKKNLNKDEIEKIKMEDKVVADWLGKNPKGEIMQAKVVARN